MIVLVVNIVGLAININAADQLKALAIQDRTNTEQIEKEQNCIAAFFLQNNRTALTLNNLRVCQPVVNTIMK
jgi:hypothetical protein